jgi:hypothetical protein
MVNPAAAQPDPGITQLPQGFNPTQAPPVQQPSPARPVIAAGGGLMSLPVNHFNESSYAGGGIVAFQSGGETAYKLPKEEMPDYALISDQPDQSDAERSRLLMAEQFARKKAGRPMLESAGTTLVNLPTDVMPVAQPRNEAGIVNLANKTVSGMTEDQVVQIAKKRREDEGVNFSPSEWAEQEKTIRSRFRGAEADPVAEAKPSAKTAPTATQTRSQTTTQKTAKPGSYESILASLPKAPEIAIPAPTSLTREQAFENIKENQRLAGVVENPYEEVNKRQAAKEKREQEAYERGGIDRLIAQASAFAKADPSRGLGYQGAVSAEASAVLQKEQDIIRDKQETAAIEFRKSIAKEEDAKRRGDAAGIEAAVTAREKAQSDYEKLRFDAAKVQNDRGTLAEKIFSAGNTAEYQKGMLGYYNRMAASTEEQKPTAEDRKLLKVQTTVNAHPVVRGIADAIKQGMITPGTPEYYEALKRINEIAKPLYRQAGLPEPEDIVGDITPPAAPKPGFWESFGSIFGGSSTPQKAVPFNQLPK